MTRELLAQDVLEELRARVAALRQAQSSGDWDALARGAHKLKGSALVLELDELAVAMVALEWALSVGEQGPALERAIAVAEASVERVDFGRRLRQLRHDLRNDLGVLVMAAGLLELELEPGAAALERVGMIGDSAARAAQRVEELRIDPRGDVPTADDKPAPAASAFGARVLLVDDDARVVAVVTAALARAGVDVTAVSSLTAARGQLAERAFDAALVDLGVEDGAGDALLPGLREHGIRAVAFTGDPAAAGPGWDATLGKGAGVEGMLAALGLSASA